MENSPRVFQNVCISGYHSKAEKMHLVDSKQQITSRNLHLGSLQS